MKLLPFLFATAISFQSRAQLMKGQWIIGGNGLISFSKSRELKFFSIQASPGVGYFFLNKLAGGVRLAFNSDTEKFTTGKFRNSTKTISPFVRYYILPVDQPVNFFIDGSYGYSWSKYRDFTHPSSYKYTGYNLSFLTGPSFFLNEHTALEVTVGYNYLSRGPIDTSITHKFQVGFGLQVHLGKQK